MCAISYLFLFFTAKRQQWASRMKLIKRIPSREKRKRNQAAERQRQS